MMMGVNHGGCRTAVLMGLLAGSWVVAHPLTALARTAPTESAPDATVVRAPLSASEIDALARPVAVDLANGDPGATSAGMGGGAHVGDGKRGLIYAQLAVALAGLLIAGTGAFAIVNRAQIRDAISWKG